jgi:chemotaxis protein CheZ
MSVLNEINQQDVADLLAALQAGDQAQATHSFEKLTQMREQQLYQSIGQMTRNLHESLKGVDDMELMQQVKHDLPDLNERINYVLSSTEQAVDTTLSASEVIGEIVDQLDELKNQLAHEHTEALDNALSSISQQLNEIMQAQSFQDLTGQVLKRMLVVMGAFEHSLLDLIQRAGQNLDDLPPRNVDEQNQDLKGVGPAATKRDNQSAQSQDDVDDLLADLGF